MEKVAGTDRVKIEGGKENLSYNKRKFNWICSILPMNCLLKHFIEGNLEGYKWREDEEEFVSACRLALRKQKYAGS
jgi:hypothetical protein